MSLLELHDLTASYGASQALFGVSLEIAEGEVLALMGRNGMGKSTTVRCLSGMMAAGGVRRFAGQDIGKLPSHRVARLGVGLVPEGRRCFRDLTVTENLIAAARPGPWDQARVEALFPRLAERRTQVSGTLSGGEQQMLAIGRALMTNPRLLVLDEATEGLAPLVRQEIWDALGVLKRESGLSILVVDKALSELAQVADRAVILERGRSVWDGVFAEVKGEVAERFLGV
ncbi:ABC transporter ATP-binding protein [Salipiger sp. PrR003]|uniref:ABC transporter ATP-binding protein n=1 Tax=Salipiger sp. PrR003 TaxID=2706776 RepID=UPI0013DADFB0|nr:ABC transporter ATP-binding protein [Salipiger sp. PrR003]NDV54025.1 ABC transporter ATP-binding protein [Salipiger sp. PrR003]